MPNFAGTWKMRSSENFDELLKALGVNAMLRKVAVAAASKPHVEIRQDGDQFYIKTSTTVRTTEINFKVGEGFEEETVDGRKCRSLATWENENKIHCTQTLLEGDGPKTYWTRELANDELILTFGADDVVCTRIYVRECRRPACSCFGGGMHVPLRNVIVLSCQWTSSSPLSTVGDPVFPTRML